MAGQETLSSSSFSTWVSPSQISGTVLTNAVTVCRRNVPHRTSVYDDDDDDDDDEQIIYLHTVWNSSCEAEDYVFAQI